MNLVPITVEMTVAESQQQFNLTVSENVMNYNMTVSEKIIAGVTPPYEGDYIVVPSVYEQILQTNGLRMTDDVTVTEIPYYETSNESGITVFIANNLNND